MGDKFVGNILWGIYLGGGDFLGILFWEHIFVDTFLATNCSQLVVCVFLCVFGDVIHGYMEGEMVGGVGDYHLANLGHQGT